MLVSLDSAGGPRSLPPYKVLMLRAGSLHFKNHESRAVGFSSPTLWCFIMAVPEPSLSALQG